VLPEQEASDGGPITATEVNKKTASMYAKASRMRQQYGAKGLVPLMNKLIKAARLLGQATIQNDVNGQPGIVRKGITLPPKMEGEKRTAYVLDDEQNAQLELVWPPFDPPTPQQTLQVVTATNLAKTGGMISARTATRKLAPHYDIEDVDAEVAQAAKEKPAVQDFGQRSLDELNQGR
jgi:hypothetical protein